MSRDDALPTSWPGEPETDDELKKRVRAARNRRLAVIMRIFGLLTTPLPDRALPPPPPPAVEVDRRTKGGQGGGREAEAAGGPESEVMGHLGRQAAATRNDADAQARIGALPMLAAAMVPSAAIPMMGAAPAMIGGLTTAAKVLRESEETRDLVRSLPTVAQRTALRIGGLARRGRRVSPELCTRILADTAVRVLREQATATGALSEAPYDGLGLRALRTAATKNRDAADALWARYQRMPVAALRRRSAANDGMAKAVLDRRSYPNDEALKQALKSRRQPHSANVIRYRVNTRPWRRYVTSGNATPEERRRFPDRRERGLATHTEARAVRMANLRSGDHLSIIGQYDPCPDCRQAMQNAALRSGATIRYSWMGGSTQFPR